MEYKAKTEVITDPRRLLAAWSKSNPLSRLTVPASTLLRCAASLQDRYDEYDEHRTAYFPLHSAYRDTVDELVLDGYLRHHPESRKRTWYGLTDEGLRIARQLQRNRIKNGSTRQVWLEKERAYQFERVVEELGDEGYYILPEPGRGWELGEVAFFNPANGRKLLVTCRLGSTDWRFYDRGYYRPYTEPALTDRDKEQRGIPLVVEDIPF